MKFLGDSLIIIQALIWPVRKACFRVSNLLHQAFPSKLESLRFPFLSRHYQSVPFHRSLMRLTDILVSSGTPQQYFIKHHSHCPTHQYLKGSNEKCGCLNWPASVSKCFLVLLSMLYNLESTKSMVFFHESTVYMFLGGDWFQSYCIALYMEHLEIPQSGSSIQVQTFKLT